MSPLYLFLFCALFVAVYSQSSPSRPTGLFIDCGATARYDNIWVLDNGYVFSGVPRSVIIPENPYFVRTLSTVRSFPLEGHIRRKFCYVLPVTRNVKYLVRTTYFYGGVNGRDSPPVFDQIVDGTFWSVVNTTEDYAMGRWSYYEGVFVPAVKTMSICVAGNTYTDSDPFISALEVVRLDNSLYNSTDFKKYGLSLVARNSFGYGGPLIKFPDDKFDRYWEPFGEISPTIQSFRNLSDSGIWNLPPSKVFSTELTSDQGMPRELRWPQRSLPNSTYYIALYFADDHDASLGNITVLNIAINGIQYYSNLSVTSAGVAVFATQWPLSGLTTITLAPPPGSAMGALINAGEVFNVLPLGGRTLTRDVVALNVVNKSLENPPLDWNGDPCLPRQYSWTGVVCSYETRIRVVALNLTSMGIRGPLSPEIANLTALTEIWLGNNTFWGTIPDLSNLKMLETLHLEDNHFSGVIPPSLGNIVKLRELFLQNNELGGEVPNSLKVKPGLNLKTYGNQFLVQAPPTN
ncbi:PREDICTED: probable LRR receptor-like serine/threonine-protein kinase At1g67720 [Nelumbo nucifera]|uniref:Probable LRR receptor-like serine/threonine-protein kinase At1g67720 n=1 Tax=Nelumbo nucifera TaxID=4432 RepID=A0A1U8B9A5_NELNU|nr:PREDICTED: probable LRR receptor-like serine/threonine-protein kinase At1g67720 [Nelumbo nucifera]